ncbi:MAG: hypothetical protein NG740_00990 [Omnitrophica bacterium]|nr:hypothetical protein [Candidatus Omnitrophota bacterium]
MNKPIKKIIAREGLVIIGILLISLILYVYAKFLGQGAGYRGLDGAIFILRRQKSIFLLSSLILLFGYPVRWLLHYPIHFILWAIRILRAK